jgi:hypothetical protein
MLDDLVSAVGGMVYEPARVRVGARCGWVRVRTDPAQVPGTLVYLTQDTTVQDICRDLVLALHYTIWLQVFILGCLI